MIAIACRCQVKATEPDTVLVVVVESFSHVQLFATPQTVPCQAPLSMEFPRQEYWSGLPFPPPGDLPNPVFEPMSPTLHAESLPPTHKQSPIKPLIP